MDLLNLAAQFVNSTASHIFLTGKAGTGKTTFLRDLAEKTHKSFVIVAPTGIAALNAKGVTIHSQFLFPMGSFIPENKPTGHYSDQTNFFTQNTLARRHPLNSVRKQVLRNIDLLIIDEVSMLRADILDAIDYRLRAVKRNFNQSFGGVQLLMIGDLFQLPPIVRPNEWQVLKQFYKSMHFFECCALQQSGFVTVELNKIFRQADDNFISILNNLRNNQATPQDIATLNTYYKQNPNTENTITVTTHNNKADQINRIELETLSGPSSYFNAIVDGDFPENIYPVPERIELKVGTQIMFAKNDTKEGKYFNGKLARVEYIDQEDGITVVMADDHEHYILKKEQWENKKYSINKSTKELDEEIVGTFEQYPIKLAWAITVHKSQGLTFTKAIIDVGQAFAPGQVYVALSRLTSLEGLTLKTKVSQSVVSSDHEVVKFVERSKSQDPLPQILDKVQVDYLIRLMAQTFNFIELEELLKAEINQGTAQGFVDTDLKEALPNMLYNLENQKEFAGIFVKQLQRLIYHHKDSNLMTRLDKGTAFYLTLLKSILERLMVHQGYVKQLAKTKTYQSVLDEIDQLIMRKWEQIDKASYITTCILNNREITKDQDASNKRLKERAKINAAAEAEIAANPKNASNKTGKVRSSKPKSTKGETYRTTYALIKEGMSINEVAISRGLTTGTIESHAARGIKEEELKITDILSTDKIKALEVHKALIKSSTANQIHEKLNGQFSYGQIRIAQTYFQKDD